MAFHTKDFCRTLLPKSPPLVTVSKLIGPSIASMPLLSRPLPRGVKSRLAASWSLMQSKESDTTCFKISTLVNVFVVGKSSNTANGFILIIFKYPPLYFSVFKMLVFVGSKTSLISLSSAGGYKARFDWFINTFTLIKSLLMMYWLLQSLALLTVLCECKHSVTYLMLYTNH